MAYSPSESAFLLSRYAFNRQAILVNLKCNRLFQLHIKCKRTMPETAQVTFSDRTACSAAGFFLSFQHAFLRGDLVKQSTCKQMLLLGLEQLLCMRRHSLSLMDGGLRLWYSENASGAVRNKMFCQVGFYASSIPKCLNQKSLPIRTLLIFKLFKESKGLD